jgi:hypothetical protein
MLFVGRIKSRVKLGNEFTINNEGCEVFVLEIDVKENIVLVAKGREIGWVSIEDIEFDRMPQIHKYDSGGDYFGFTQEA